MTLRYIKIKKKPTTFNSLFGVPVSQFEKILIKVDPEWNKRVLARYKRPGRPYDHPLEDMILMLLLYYRSYITQEFVGYLFDLDKSRVCRIIQKLEPILATVMAISKRKHLSKEDVENLILDATEQPIERPKRGQKPYYSGKKKRHTIKTELRINSKGRIVHVSKSRPGSVHDFMLHKQEPPLPPNARVFVDSGYQGIDKLHGQIEFPYKASKNKSLDKEEKEYNTALSRIRVKVENIIGDIKTFRILSDRYRNKRKRYNIKFNIIAGIVNLKNGFAPA
jgi:hypothetical protein